MQSCLLVIVHALSAVAGGQTMPFDCSEPPIRPVVHPDREACLHLWSKTERGGTCCLLLEHP